MMESLQGNTMGTTWSVRFGPLPGGPSRPSLMAQIQLEFAAITQQMSTWDAASTISCLNDADPGWYQLPEQFFQVLASALDIAAKSAGAYDPTLGKLNDLWGFGPAGARATAPDRQQIDACLATAGWRRTALNHEHHAVWQPGGIAFDLSSIAKGYGVDQLASILDQHHIDQYLVEVGGELKARGQNSRNTPWDVAIDIPDDAAEPGPALRIALVDGAIATSGDYRRYVEHDGRRYAHTLDSATGAPVAHNLASVSVVHPQCMLADALATGLLSMGPQRGPAYAREHKISALFMHRHSHDLALEWTPGFPMPATSRQCA